jgi:hypothetical protein
MAMGKRRRHANQASMWVATQDLPRGSSPHDRVSISGCGFAYFGALKTAFTTGC